MNNISYVAFFSLSIFSTLSFAIGNDIIHKFEKLDKNKDGFLTRAETAIDPALWSRFVGYDQDKDGKLTRSEYHLYVDK